ncbi:MAG TPA: DinB family protein [Acidisarcina sp.]
MSEPVLTCSELLQWSDETFVKWEALLAGHREALDFPCDIYKSKTVRDLLVHIVAVQLRYAERLGGEPVTPYEEISAESVEQIFDVHRLGMEKLRALLPGDLWDDVLEFPTLTSGTIRATRKKLFIHGAMHGIRHFAQLATLVRQHGIKPGWPMDFLGSSAMA